MKPTLFRTCRMIGLPPAAAAFALLASPVRAQTAAAPDSTNQQVIHLGTFTVNSSKDNGYMAGDTMSISRLSTSLLKTPSDISVLTSQFLSDVGATDLAMAEVYLTGATPSQPNGDGYSFGTDIGLRGLPTSNNLRNYFNMQTSTVNGYIAARVEGMRGTNSILYGPTNIGGEVNVLTKSAEFRDFGSLKVFSDTYGTFGTWLDVNRKLNDQLAVRVNGDWENNKNWISKYYNAIDAADVTATYKPFENTQIRVEGEDSYRKTASVGSNSISDNASYWNGVGVTAPLAAGTPPAGSTGVSPINSDHLVYSPAIWGGVLDFKGYGVSTGTGLGLYKGAPMPSGSIFPVMPARNWRAAPADSHTYQKDYVFQVNIDQTLPGDGQFEFAVFHLEGPGERDEFGFGDVKVDVNKVLPDGSPNPEFGRLYSEGTYWPSTKYDQYRTDYRTAIAYPLKTRWGTQSFSFVADQWGQQFFPQQRVYSWLNNPADPNGIDGVNEVNLRQYWDQPVDSLLDGLPAASGPYQFGWITARQQKSTQTLHGYSLNTSGNWFHDTLSLVAGVRRDFIHIGVNDIKTQAANGQPSSWYETEYRFLDTSGSAGLVYFPEPYVGVYADYQQGFNPITASISTYPTLSGKALESSTTAKGKSAGLRLRLFDGRLVGSAGYYESEESGKLITHGAGDINNIWNQLNLSRNDIIGGGYGDVYGYKGQGVEADITANLTQNLRLIFNFGAPRTEKTGGDLDTLNYYNAHIAAWRAAEAGLDPATQSSIDNSIRNIQNLIEGAANGRTLNGTYKYRANFNAVYEFTRGSWRGFRVGGGAQMFGENLIGNTAGAPFDYIYSQTYTILSAMCGYSFKVASGSIDVQANISNLLNYDRPIFTGATTIGGVNYDSSFYYYAPTTARFTVTYRF